MTKIFIMTDERTGSTSLTSLFNCYNMKTIHDPQTRMKTKLKNYTDTNKTDKMLDYIYNVMKINVIKCCYISYSIEEYKKIVDYCVEKKIIIIVLHRENMFDRSLSKCICTKINNFNKLVNKNDIKPFKIDTQEYVYNLNNYTKMYTMVKYTLQSYNYNYFHVTYEYLFKNRNAHIFFKKLDIGNIKNEKLFNKIINKDYNTPNKLKLVLNLEKLQKINMSFTSIDNNFNVSHSKKKKNKIFIIHIPKTAGCSIVYCLEHQGLLLNRRKHVYAKNLLKIDSKDSIIMAVVRNPYDRLYSIYQYYRHPEVYSSVNKARLYGVSERNVIDQNMSFEDFILNFEKKYYKTRIHFTTCFDLIASENNKLLTTDILRFESLTNDFNLFCKKYKIKNNLIHKNVNIKKDTDIDWSKLYTLQMRNIVERIFKIDFTTFNYSYEDFLQVKKNITKFCN